MHAGKKPVMELLTSQRLGNQDWLRLRPESTPTTKEAARAQGGVAAANRELELEDETQKTYYPTDCRLRRGWEGFETREEEDHRRWRAD